MPRWLTDPEVELIRGAYLSRRYSIGTIERAFQISPEFLRVLIRAHGWRRPCINGPSVAAIRRRASQREVFENEVHRRVASGETIDLIMAETKAYRWEVEEALAPAAMS